MKHWERLLSDFASRVDQKARQQMSTPQVDVPAPTVPRDHLDPSVSAAGEPQTSSPSTLSLKWGPGIPEVHADEADPSSTVPQASDLIPSSAKAPYAASESDEYRHTSHPSTGGSGACSESEGWSDNQSDVSLLSDDERDINMISL